MEIEFPAFTALVLTVPPHEASRMTDRRFLLSGVFLFTSWSLSTANDGFKEVVAPFLKQHCMACHGAQKQEAQLRYDRLEDFKPGDRHLWTMVHNKLSDREMPPDSRPQPTDTDRNRVLSWIAKMQRASDPGSTRRLNRRELAAALRDLTGLGIDYAYALPGDGNVDGFDTGAEALQDAADGVTQIMQITRRAVDGIRFLEPPKESRLLLNLRDTKDAKKNPVDELKPLGVEAKGQSYPRPGVGLLLEPRASGERETYNIRIPAPADRQGIMRLKLVVSAMKPMEGLPNPKLWLEVSGKELDFFEVIAPFETPHELTYDIQLDDLAIQSKISIHLSNKVEVPYSVKGYENDDRTNLKDPVPGGTGLFRPVYDRRTVPPEKAPAPFIVLQSIEIESPYTAAWPPESWNVKLGEPLDDPAYARKLLNLWMERAWRRPVTEAEASPFLSLYMRLRKTDTRFDQALRAAFQSVLLSAPFRYLGSPETGQPALSHYAIASRLSFMLVGEPPDAELRKLAAAGKLRDPTILDAQVDRLIADPRSLAFVKPFTYQWLEMEQPITIAMDHIQKQYFRFGRNLKASMKAETYLYVREILRENRPAHELLQSDWTMMNDILAIHYGYEGIEGGELRKVKLKPNDPRGGGILSHGGIQSMLCWMGENWVIYRGAWALRHILDQPPPPPPLEVPELNPSDGANKGKPFRVLLKQHQEDTRCAVCHKKMDPLGFAFQNFDISGLWRDVEHESYSRAELDGKIAWKGVGVTRPVDTTGQLPRGEQFKTYAEFKTLLVKNYQKNLVRGILKNFMLYATGRKADVDAMTEIANIMKDEETKGFPMREMLKGVVKSKSFLER